MGYRIQMQTKIIFVARGHARFVIPGLTRNPVFSWIPAFAGMTTFGAVNVVVHIRSFSFWILRFDIPLTFGF